MSVKQQDKQIFTLSQVAGSIRKTINERYKRAYWIKAELNKLNYYRHSGHCYPDLVEKKDGRITAQLRAILWKEDYRLINNRFVEMLNEPLKDGIKILFYARITYDPLYGLSLRILDIDPSFTLGDLEKEKQDCIRQLQSEGLFLKNKQLKLPLLPQRMAIISVETSKGYADFVRIIDGNPWKYRFFHMLFPALLQGDKAVYSIMNQLQNISRVKQHFDLVAIIRGGGGDIGLSCYNKYLLAKAVSQFPLPVLTGIGHATNETVTEMVAFANEITPSKLAESLIQHFHNFAVNVNESAQSINNRARRGLEHANHSLRNAVLMFRSNASGMLSINKSQLKEHTRAIGREAFVYGRQIKNYVLKQEESRLHTHAERIITDRKNLMAGFQTSLASAAPEQISKNRQEIILLKEKVEQLKPENVLKRGYSITRCKGKAITAKDQLKTGNILQTELFDGSVTSEVINDITNNS